MVTQPADNPQDPVSLLLGLSDERDLELKLRLAAYREGYAAAAAQFPGYYERGYTDAQSDRKAAEHGAVRDWRHHLRMWDGLREDFGKPRDGDYAGAEMTARGGGTVAC